MEPSRRKVDLPPIPAKRYFTIGEVSDLCAVKPHVLRYWEQEFTQLKPVKRRGNRRYYQHHEVLLIRRIRDLLFEKVGLNKREAKDMVEAFFEEIRGALERGESVKLSGFGNFQLRDKPQRPGRNPKTGEEIPISARRVVTFHASQKLKAMVEKSRNGSEPKES